jgi:CDGSH-type Zn-finger protein/uncharacterized membrane protein YozB (DUF420 family)
MEMGGGEMSEQAPAAGTVIEVLPDGPYRVSGPCRLRNSRGEEVPARATFALCRCGNSSRKPFCDGTHTKIAFHGARLNVGATAATDAYAGKRVTIHDNRAICAHSGVCTDNLAAVFRLNTEPWIDPHGATAEEIMALVKRCPSGALSCSVDGSQLPAEPREREITASKDGPLVVAGAVELKTDGAQPRFSDRYTLCRCGGSKNKPFCDGTHWAIGFDESRGRQAGVFVPPLGVTRFAWICGGLLIAGTVAAVLGIMAAGKETAPALGPAGLLYDLNVILNLLLIAGLTFGYWLARRGNIAAHRYNQTIWMLVNAVLVALIMVGSLAEMTPKAAADLARPNVLVPWVHAALGSATIFCGLWLVLQMNGWLPQRLHVRGWKTMMKATLAGYWVVALLGLAVYFVLFFP